MTDFFPILGNTISEIRDGFDASDQPAAVASLERGLEKFGEAESASRTEALVFLLNYLVEATGDRGHDLMILNLISRRRTLPRLDRHRAIGIEVGVSKSTGSMSLRGTNCSRSDLCFIEPPRRGVLTCRSRGLEPEKMRGVPSFLIE
jgi:hypothetical protein